MSEGKQLYPLNLIQRFTYQVATTAVPWCKPNCAVQGGTAHHRNLPLIDTVTCAKKEIKSRRNKPLLPRRDAC